MEYRLKSITNNTDSLITLSTIELYVKVASAFAFRVYELCHLSTEVKDQLLTSEQILREVQLEEYQPDETLAICFAETTFEYSVTVISQYRFSVEFKLIYQETIIARGEVILISTALKSEDRPRQPQSSTVLRKYKNISNIVNNTEYIEQYQLLPYLLV